MPEVIRLEPCLGSGHSAFAHTALTRDTNCLVLFDAPWRRPAKHVETQAADVADRYAVTLLSIDVDDCRELARRYQMAYRRCCSSATARPSRGASATSASAILRIGSRVCWRGTDLLHIEAAR
jgi:Thioredoxin